MRCVATSTTITPVPCGVACAWGYDAPSTKETFMTGTDPLSPSGRPKPQLGCPLPGGATAIFKQRCSAPPYTGVYESLLSLACELMRCHEGVLFLDATWRRITPTPIHTLNNEWRRTPIQYGGPYNSCAVAVSRTNPTHVMLPVSRVVWAC